VYFKETKADLESYVTCLGAWLGHGGRGGRRGREAKENNNGGGGRRTWKAKKKESKPLPPTL
jgi:hypothetical protein